MLKRERPIESSDAFRVILTTGRPLLGGGAVDSGSSGPGSSPGLGTVLCSWARHLTLVAPFSTQVYKSAPTNYDVLQVRVRLRPDGPLGSYLALY